MDPNIVAIYNSGSHEGEPFFVMEFVDAKPLRPDAAEGRRQSSADRVGHRVAAARCLRRRTRRQSPSGHQAGQHADGRRDGDQGDGLRHLAHHHLAPDQVGAVMGTPRYMSPEQTPGGDAVDARSDISSLRRGAARAAHRP